MRLKNELVAVGRHYFDSDVNTAFDDNHNIAFIGLYGLVISWILAFFTIGVPSSFLKFDVPVALFILGIVVFGAGAILHVIFFILGAFYKHGVLKSIGVGVLSSLGIICLAVVGGFILYGGTFVGAFVFLFLLPADTIFMPFNIIGFLATAIIWYARGIRIVEGDEPRRVFSFEIEKMDNLRQRVAKKLA